MTEKKKTGGKSTGRASVVNDRRDSAQTLGRLGVLARSVEQGPGVVVITDTAGKIEYVNPKFTAVTGYPPEEAVGKQASGFDERSSEDHQELGETLASGRDWRGELRNKRKNGELYWLSASITPIRSSNGIITHYLGVGEDITERKRAEEALRESDDEWRSLVENIPDIVMTLDRDGTILFINRTVPGLTNDEVIETSGYDYLPPEHHDTVRRALERVFDTGDGHRYETAGTGPFGRTSWYLSSIGPIVRDGRVVAAALIATDITERKRAEEALRKSEEKYRDLVENLNDVIYEVDASGRVTYVSPVAEEFAGYSPSELLGRTFIQYVEPDDRERVLEGFEKTLRGVLKPIEFRVSIKSGEVRWVRVASRLVVREGRAVGMRGVLTDINERKRAEEALRESEERYRRLVELSPYAIVVHSEGRMMFVNSAGVELFGAENAGDIVGRPLWDFVHPDYLDAVRERVQRTRPEGKKVDLVEEKLVRVDGQVIDAEMAAIPITYLGKPARQVVLRDISERKRAEEALREREQTMLALLNAPTESALLADLDGTILALNDIAARRLGKNVDDVVGLTIWSLTPPGVIAFRMAKGEEVQRSGNPCRFQDTRDGMWFDTTVYPIFDADGQVVRLAIFASDITELKEMEGALQKTREELECKVESQMQRGDPYGLTFREMTVLHLVVAGSSDREIGTTLGISTQTASKHITNILSKMGASSRTEAGVRALKEGWLD